MSGNCTWSLGTKEVDPHPHCRPEQQKILPNILHKIGDTPLVRINKIAEEAGLECELLAKCEFFNAGGSVKDRIGLRMVEDAEKSGRLKPGDVLIEPTSGNTGIGLALAAAVKGYRTIITLPEKMSNEKVFVLRALGAEIIRTPTEAAWDSPESHIGVANRLNKEIPNSHILNQYDNPSNPLAHYDGTAEEIIEQTEGKVDMVVISAGTGGTITGIARKLKEKIPNVKIVGVDPIGSILAVPDTLNTNKDQPYKVEGIGYDFIPKVLDRNVVDFWVKSNDKDSLLMSRKLIRQEGILCGGSSGAAMQAAVQACKTLGKGQRCVVILPDSVRNYMTKFLNDDWMAENGFTDEDTHARQQAEREQWGGACVGDLQLPEPVTISSKATISEAIAALSAHGFDNLPVVAPSGRLVGLVTEGNLMSRVASGQVARTDEVARVMFRFSKKRKYEEITVKTPLESLQRFFEKNSFGIVTEESDSARIKSVITKIDLLSFLVNKSAK
eukprot:Colp12_sorted_trinity150504_noHs@23350